MIFLELFRVNNAEVSTDTPMGVAAVGAFEFLFISLGEISHGTFELGKDGAWRKSAGGKNAELRFAGTVRVSLRVSNLDGTRWEVEFHITRSVTVF